MSGVNGLPINVLADLVDVAASSPADGSVLTWMASTSEWTPQALPAAPVSSVFGRTGAVVAASGDYAVGQITGAAPLASPELTGTPTAPTATAGTATTQIATTAFVAAVDATAMHKAGNETITGTKTYTVRSTFSAGITCPMGVSANNNEALGSAALVSVGASTGSNNTAVGQAAGQSITTGNNNTIVGRSALATATTGVSSAVTVGYAADVGKTTGTGTTAVGASTSTAGFSNSAVIGVGATATASNQIMLGTASETVVAPNNLKVNTAASGAVPIHIGWTGVAGQHIYPGIWFTTETPTVSNYAFLSDVGLGTILNAPTGRYVAIRIGNSHYLHVEEVNGVQVRSGRTLTFAGDTSTTVHVNIARITPSWADNTHATRKGRLVCSVQDATTTREAWRAESDGAQALLSFFGKTPAVARPIVTGSWSGGTAGPSLLAALVALGLATDSTTP